MKRSTLLITIAAIAVVGIAVGLLLSGAGQTGSLQGRLEPISTTLTIGYTVGREDGMGGYELIFNGRLTDATGAPVANRPVTLKFRVPPETVINDGGTATTKADGSYDIVIHQWSSYYHKYPVYRTEFAGGDMFLASRSPDVQGP